MAVPEINVTDFSQLPPDEVARYRDQANWMVTLADGTQRGDWTRIEDPKYRVRFDHVQVKWGNDIFDKCNQAGWGTYVLPMRVTPSSIAEFCLNRERRILLRDDSGQQGNVFVPNIPQGGVRPGESYVDAAVRETLEETGRQIADILLIGRSGFDIANSEAIQDIHLALVPNNLAPGEQTTETTEEIEEKWYNWVEVGELGDIVDCKTEAALFKAQRFLDPRLLLPEVYGRFVLDPRFLGQQESLEWYVKPEHYSHLKQQTVPNYHPFDNHQTS